MSVLAAFSLGCGLDIGAINQAHPAFAIHVGDTWGAEPCTEAQHRSVLATFAKYEPAVFYTPGDNEWTDCHAQQGVPGGDPLERLTKLRGLFFNGEQSFGQRTLALTRQSANGEGRFDKYRENVRWDLGGITFLTLHVVGSNNGLGRRAHERRSRLDAPRLRARACEQQPRAHDLSAGEYLSRVSTIPG